MEALRIKVIPERDAVLKGRSLNIYNFLKNLSPTERDEIIKHRIVISFRMFEAEKTQEHQDILNAWLTIAKVYWN